MRVRNLTRQTVLGDSVVVADTSRKRRTGLLEHENLATGAGLWIVPCEAIHTIGMKFPIDVIFLNRSRKVLKIRPRMGPWRLSCCLRARSVLELPAGAAEQTGTRPGDVLEFEH
ncbi:MAG: DUF192 domain-containing protein [Bryobacteraceae bacterium]|nr:DUF192 domain-containing protein [Bryobacteraceae bacterium]